jgi:phage anti-repressor protein/phage antirepressor YoqD-like protein
MSDIISLAETIVPINRENGKLSVNARDLHAFLEVGKDFSTWVKDRINQFGFVDGLDFEKMENLSSPISGSAKARPQTATDYLLSLDMAKELSMVERTDKGKQARQYFIACERQLKQQAALAAFNIPQSYSAALRLCADQQDVIEEKDKQLAIAAPKVAFHDAVTESSDVCQLAVAAQVAKLPFGRNTLFQKLRQMGVLISGTDRHNLPKQEYVTRGYFTVNERKIQRPDTGEPMITFTTYATQKGIAWIVDKFGGTTA